jgi:hypothetical protein
MQTPTGYDASAIIGFIEAHGQAAVYQDGELFVLSHSYRAVDEKSFYEWERCEASTRAVRNWLGY